MKAKPLPGSADLKERYALDATVESGLVHAKVFPRGGSRRPGKMAGTKQDYGWVVNFDGRLLAVSRVIWKLYYGTDPPGLIDHVDLNPFNNVITNLRVASKSQNGMNRTMYKCNKTGAKGVIFARQPGRYIAQIRFNKAYKYLGTFNSLDEAATTYAAAVKKYHGEYGRV
jgi:HNH endonuclease